MRRTALSLAALLLAACSGTDSGPPDMPRDDVHYRWQEGDCLAFEAADALPAEPFGTAAVVDCGGEHGWEVVHAADIDDPADAPYPDDLVERSRESCAAAFHGYVGAHQSETSLDVVVLRPDRAAWSQGFRFQACLVLDPSAGADPPVTVGSLRGAGAAHPMSVEAGMCFEGRSVLGPAVPCSEPHLAEAIGAFTHPGGGGAPWPGAAGVRSEANAGCSALLDGYATRGAGPVPGEPVAYARPLTRVEWDDGLRTVACGVLMFDTDMRHVTVVGSLSDPDWRVIEAGRVA